MTPIWVLFVAFLAVGDKEEPPMLIATDGMMHCHKLMLEARKQAGVQSANCKLALIARVTE